MASICHSRPFREFCLATHTYLSIQLGQVVVARMRLCNCMHCSLAPQTVSLAMQPAADRIYHGTSTQTVDPPNQMLTLQLTALENIFWLFSGNDPTRPTSTMVVCHILFSSGSLAFNSRPYLGPSNTMLLTKYREQFQLSNYTQMSRNPSLVYLYSNYVPFLYFCPFSKRCAAYVK